MVSFTPNKRMIGSVASIHSDDEYSSGLNAQFKWFAILWAIASLFHMAHSSVFDSQVNFALLTLACFYVVFRPTLFGFLLLIVLQVFDAFYRMPFTTNHWIFTAFVNLTFLHCLLYLVWHRRTFDIKASELIKVAAPLVRIELIVLYFFAVFHKLNAGFFADGSCATDLLRAQQIDNIIALPSSFYKLNGYLTLLIEAAIPLLLCFRKSRTAGILIGVIFHAILSYSSYNAFYDFSSMVFAVYFLFTSPELSLKITNHVNALKLKLANLTTSENFSPWKLLKMFGLIFLFLALTYILTKKLKDFHAVHLLFWTVFSALYLFFFCRNQIFNGAVSQDSSIFNVHRHSLILLVIPFLVFINGLSPYFGLKTENSYAMFSNLKTEGGSSNHFIMPAGLQLFDYQKDVVDVISTTDPNLQKLANENLSMVWFEFNNYLHEQKPAEVRYLRNGREQLYAQARPDTHPPKNNYVFAKLMKFRAFSKDGVQPCAH